MPLQPKGKVRQPKEYNKNIQSHQTIKKRTDEKNDQGVERSSFPKSFSKPCSENNAFTASTPCAVGSTTPPDNSISYKEMSISFFEGRQFYSVEDDKGSELAFLHTNIADYTSRSLALLDDFCCSVVTNPKKGSRPLMS
jgi:hypothetical protein